MPRTGKQVDELFASTKPRAKKSAPAAAPTVSDTERGRGRPRKADRDPTSPATVILYEAQIVQLDEIANQVRARSRKVIKRADVIRGILSAVLSAGLDLGAATSEEDVRATVAARLKSARPTK